MSRDNSNWRCFWQFKSGVTAAVLATSVWSGTTVSETIKIIGIHGLANKPAESVLTEWWIQSLNDGFEAYCGDAPRIDTHFQMVYWRDLRYPSADPNPEPYTKPIENLEDSWLKAKPVVDARNAVTDILGDVIEFSDNLTEEGLLDAARNAALGQFAPDLNSYYNEDKIGFGPHEGMIMKEVARQRLTDTISEHQGKTIVLIAHSMGSIVAYDVLLDLESSTPPVVVEHLITIGSPLGLAPVKSRIVEERGDQAAKGPPVPKTITVSWLNHADKKDPIATDTNITDEFDNEHSITFKDARVINNYGYETTDGIEHNAHKSYGYLRTEQIATALCSILGGEE